jgi:hypothetical protein
MSLGTSVNPSPARHPILWFALLLAGALAIVVVWPFVLLVFWALGSETLFVTSFHWHVLVLVVAGGAVVALVAAVLKDVQGVKGVARTPKAVGLVVCWLVLLVAVTGAVYRVGGDSPTSTSPPLVLGTPELGAALRADPGRWSTSLSRDEFSYAWERCVQDECEVVAPHDAGRRYVLEDSDVGGRMRVCVVAVPYWWSSTETCSVRTRAVRG